MKKTKQYHNVYTRSRIIYFANIKTHALLAHLCNQYLFLEGKYEYGNCVFPELHWLKINASSTYKLFQTGRHGQLK